MRKVFKYLLVKPGGTIEIEEGCIKVGFGRQSTNLALWGEVDTVAPKKKWIFKRVEITAFPKWDELIELKKGSMFLGGAYADNLIFFYLYFLEPVGVTEIEQQGYALANTGYEIPIEDAVHVGMMFDDDKHKSDVVHIYRFF